MLSQVKNGRGNPTFRMLYRIAGALGVEVEQLLEPSPMRPTAIVRRADPRRTRTARGVRITAMTPTADRGLAVYAVNLTPGAEHDVLGDYDGDFCVWVRTGTLTIKSGDISVDLGAGGHRLPAVASACMGQCDRLPRSTRSPCTAQPSGPPQ